MKSALHDYRILEGEVVGWNDPWLEVTMWHKVENSEGQRLPAAAVKDGGWWSGFLLHIKELLGAANGSGWSAMWGRKLLQEALPRWPISWALLGPTKWASIWGLKGVWLGFEMLSSSKSIFLGPIKFPRFKRLNNDVLTRIWLINSMWNWFNQLIKHNARNRIKNCLEANFRVWENHLGFWFQPSFWGFNWIPII